MVVIDQDTFFSKLFATGLSNPNSKAYIPGILANTKNPSLNPYKLDSLDVGKQSFEGITFDLSLSNLTISGIPNVTVNPALGGSFKMTDLTIDLQAELGKLASPPPGAKTLIFASDFSAKLIGAGSDTLPGSLSVTISEAALIAEVVISGNQLVNIVTTINSMSAAVPSTAVVTPKVTLSGSGSAFFEKLFEDFLQKPSTVQMILGQVNDQIKKASVRDSIGKEVTTLLQNALKEQLG